MTSFRRHAERHRADRIGWLRAAVLGANDGMVSTASLVVGVAAAGSSHGNILMTGVAGLVAGAMSMAAGEYVSVHSQADTENADLARERAELEKDPAAERRELTAIYVGRGLESGLAQQVAEQLMTHDAIGAHGRDELGIFEAHSLVWKTQIEPGLRDAINARILEALADMRRGAPPLEPGARLAVGAGLARTRGAARAGLVHRALCDGHSPVPAHRRRAMRDHGLLGHRVGARGIPQASQPPQQLPQRRLLRPHARGRRHHQFPRSPQTDRRHQATRRRAHCREHRSGGGQGARRHAADVPVLSGAFGRCQHEP